MTGLTQALAIARREAGAFFAAPVAPVVAVLFLVVQGFSFFAVVRVLADPRRPAPYGAVLRTHFGGTFLYWAFLFFVVAALTMRLCAEERRAGTWETLRTAPVSGAAIVFGKWLGALAAYLGLWLPTLAHVAILALLAPREAALDPGPVATAYLGVAATGASALAVGVLGSALARSQMVAAALTFVGLLVLLLVALLPDLAPETLARAPAIAAVASAVDVRRHMDDFARGVVDSRHLGWHAGLAVLALVAAAAAIAVERRRRDLQSAALGLALTVAAVALAGVLVARHPLRLDATRARVYTLEERTREILAGVRAPATLLVLTAGRPEFAELYDEVGELARRFQAVAPPGMLRVDRLDPALDPGRIDELADQIDLAPGELAGGGAVVVSSGGRTRAVALLDMAGFSDEGDGGLLAWFRGEEALAAALLEVTDPDRPEVCFHGGPPLEAAAGGLDLVRAVATLSRDGFAARTLPSLASVPASCAAVAVVGPPRPVPAEAVATYLARGGRLLVAAGDGPTGLEELLARHGIALRDARVVDPDAEIGAPLVWATLNGYGEHPVVAGFGGRRLTIWHRPRWVETRGAAPLVLSSPRGWAESDVAALRAGAGPGEGDVPGPVAIAAAAESVETAARIVVFGAARSFATGELERNGAANDALLSRAIAWLTGRTQRLGIGPKTPEQLRVTLTAAQERLLFWGCVVALPALAGAIGAVLVWLRRRRG
jgi:ABC-2 type transport system permease protein